MRLNLIRTAIAAAAFCLFGAAPSHATFFDSSQPVTTFSVKNKTSRVVITAVSLKELACYPKNINSADPTVISAATRRADSIFWKTSIAAGKRATLAVYGECWAGEVILWSNGRQVAVLKNQLITNIKTMALEMKGKRALVRITDWQPKIKEWRRST